MNFQEILKEFPSKAMVEILAKSIITSPSQMDNLWLMASNNEKNSWRAAWIMDKIYQIKPELVSPYIPKMIPLTLQINDTGKLRQFLKLISMEPLSLSSINGSFLDSCFFWVNSQETPVAVRVYAMQILYHISLVEPDIIPELTSIIYDHMDKSTPGFRSRGKKILKALGK